MALTPWDTAQTLAGRGFCLAADLMGSCVAQMKRAHAQLSLDALRPARAALRRKVAGSGTPGRTPSRGETLPQRHCA